jgi:TPR repeat protein
MNALKYIGIALYIPLAFLYYLGALGCISVSQDNSNKPNVTSSVAPSRPSGLKSESAKPAVAQEAYPPSPVPRGAPYSYFSSDESKKKAELPLAQQSRKEENTAVTATPTPVREIIPPKKSNSENRQEVNETEVLSFAQALQLANDGDARAQAIVSIYYGVGYKTQKDTEKAADFAMRSAKQRNGLGIYRVATMMENGEGFEKNPSLAQELKMKSYAGLNNMEGDPYAINALGIMFLRGEGGAPLLPPEAARLFHKAAEMGYAPAQYNYSAALALGQGVTKNQEESMRWWRRAFEQDYPPAMSGPVGQASSNANPVQNTATRPTASSKPKTNQRLPRGIPVGGRPGFVSSPYAPGAGIVDARGAASGDTVICPFTKQPFLLP